MRSPQNLDPVAGKTVLTMRGQHCWISMAARPHYCDRGRVLVHVEVTNPRALHVDDADMFPRYYFDIEVAKREIKDWMECQGQVVLGEDWRLESTDAEDIPF